uniref:uncharacterized protein LOC105353379 n=1 Tax=Fragaria vesca subsp. vesca TaxID=101020 RepID=UPI0005C8FB06
MIKRLRPLLTKCISKNQGAFAPGRSIHDNILIAREIFSDFNRRSGRNGAMAVKLDLEKAYDLLDCEWKTERQLDKLARNSKAQVGLLSSPFGFRVSNLMFADDCLKFAKATKKAAGNINTVLNAFKSSIGKYLGINNVVFWKDPINAKDLMQKLSKRLAGWKQNTLSRAGKLTLIKSNVAGMPNHVMACFKWPKKLKDDIDKQERNFLWGTEMKQSPVAWKDICKPKALGGLGIRPSTFFNNAALAKLSWKIITDKNNWWVQ